VLSDDPFESALDASKDIRVETVLVGSRVVHE